MRPKLLSVAHEGDWALPAPSLHLRHPMLYSPEPLPECSPPVPFPPGPTPIHLFSSGPSRGLDKWWETCMKKMSQWRGRGTHPGSPVFTPRPKPRVSSISCICCSCPSLSCTSAGFPGGIMARGAWPIVAACVQPTLTFPGAICPSQGPQLQNCPVYCWPLLSPSPPGPFLSRSESLTKPQKQGRSNAGLLSDASR